MSLRERFWRWVHRQSEALWHWSYYHKVLEYEPKYKPQNILYSMSEGFKKASESSNRAGPRPLNYKGNWR